MLHIAQKLNIYGLKMSIFTMSRTFGSDLVFVEEVAVTIEVLVLLQFFQMVFH